jgi:AcrR family transcriptional regulator
MTKPKKQKIRMNGKERRLSIVKSALPIFAKKGYHGTTVRSIAEAAGISEALLYQHFSGKEDIYCSLGELQKEQIMNLLKAFKKREPGSKTLMEIVYCLVMIILSDIHGKTEIQHAFDRLLAYSILENVEFTKTVFLIYEQELTPLWNQCLAVAKQRNEIKKNFQTRNCMWLIHHIAMAINFLTIAGNKVFNYEGAYDDLVEDVIQFALLGTGLKDDVVARYYRPDDYQKLIKQIYDQL